MNTMASTFFSSPPVTSPRLTRAASCQQLVDRVGAPVLERQEVALGHASTSSRPASSRSASAWRTTAAAAAGAPAGSVAVPVRMRRPKSARCTSAAGRPRCRPSSSPRPDTVRTPSARAPRRQVLADRDRVGDQPLALDHADVGQGGGAGHRPAAEGAAEIAEGERVGEQRARDDRADRQAAGQSLGERQRVRGHADRLGRAERATAADAALHLVEEEHGTALVAEAPGRGEELERTVARAGEPLHRLDQHRGDVVVHRRVERRDVVEGHLPAQRDAGAARRFLVAGPVGAGERRGRTPVPAAPHRDDRLPPGVAPGQVQRVLVGFRARVAEEHPPERIRTQLRQLLGQALPLRQRHGGRVEQELRRLLGDGAHDVGMAVPGRGDRVTAVGIEPLVRRPRPPARSRGPAPAGPASGNTPAGARG